MAGLVDSDRMLIQVAGDALPVLVSIWAICVPEREKMCVKMLQETKIVCRPNILLREPQAHEQMVNSRHE